MIQLPWLCNMHIIIYQNGHFTELISEGFKMDDFKIAQFCMKYLCLTFTLLHTGDRGDQPPPPNCETESLFWTPSLIELNIKSDENSLEFTGRA